MRKITSVSAEGKKQRRNQIIAGIILLAVMFLSVLGYSTKGSNNNSIEKVSYNGFEFVKQNNLWLLQIGNLNFGFVNNPTQVEKVSTKLEPLSTYYGQPLYVYSANSDADSEIYRNLNQIAKRIQKACYEEEKCTEDIPFKDCNNKFIIIEESNKTEIIQNKSCVFIHSPVANLTQMSDEFLFKILGVEE